MKEEKEKNLGYAVVELQPVLALVWLNLGGSLTEEHLVKDFKNGNKFYCSKW